MDAEINIEFQKKKVRHDWRRRVFRFGIWNLLYRFWFRLRVEGWENIPSDGPVIMMGNHMGVLDPVIMISFYPDRDIVPLAKIEAFDEPVIRYFVRHWGAIPVKRGTLDLKALKSSIDTIERGLVAMLYAEGTRSKTGLIKGQEGTAYLAHKTGAQVVPVAIWGTRDFPYSWWREFRRTQVTIRFGKPFKFIEVDKRALRDNLEAMTEEAMYRIAAILPPEWRGVYADLSRATQHYIDTEVNWTPVQKKLPRRVVVDSGPFDF
nr:1-acyl-sn-glycerol-3-phosphate acyltransferase [Anaerolineae bacterium]